MKTTQNNIPGASFTVACERDFGDRKTDFFSCTAWRGTAEFIGRNFQKGKMAIISGRLQNNEWKDKDGNKRISAEIVVENIYFCESKKQSADISAADFHEIADEEELPF